MVTRSALLYLSRQEGLKDFAARFRLFKKLTTRFVAGEDIEETVAAIRLLNAIGCSATFDHLNESVGSAAETEAEVREYLDILSRIDESAIDSNVSIKLTQFGLEIDPELAYQNVRRVVVDSTRRGNIVRIDGLQRLELLHELMPAVTKIAFLINSANKALAESDTMEAQETARALGINLLVLSASNQSEIDAAFAILAREQAGALLTNSESLFMVHSNHLALLTARHAVPALYAYRENATAGGLMSYGADFLNAARELGLYTGRILKGEKPGDLPVQQATKIELVINMKTAKSLGIQVPLPLLGRADEVIE